MIAIHDATTGFLRKTRDPFEFTEVASSKVIGLQVVAPKAGEIQASPWMATWSLLANSGADYVLPATTTTPIEVVIHGSTFLAKENPGRCATFSINLPDLVFQSNINRHVFVGGASLSLDERVFIENRRGDPEFAALILGRLSELRLEYREEEGREISAASVRQFLKLLNSDLKLRAPGIVLSPSGNVIAEWHRGPGRLLSLHFLPDESVRFVVFAPNRKKRDRTIRLSGTSDVDSVLDDVRQFGVMDWAAREG